MPKKKSSRPLQKGDTSARSSRQDTLNAAREEVLNALVVNPAMPAAELASIVLQNVDSDLSERLSEIFIQEFFVKVIRTERRKRTSESLFLPGFEHLPKTLEMDGPSVKLLEARYSDVRAYYWKLRRRHTEKGQNDPKIREAKALMVKMKKHARAEKGITVRQVLLLEALEG